MKKPPKIGRRASPEERERAREIVDLYRKAEAAGGRLVLNPEDDFDERTVFYAEPDWLLARLEHFAANGTFAETWDLRRLVANAIKRRMRPHSVDRDANVADMLHVSKRTAARLTSRKRK